jgi:hypothetical protein
MDNVTYLDVPQIDGSVKTFAIIDKGNGEYTSMPKTDYEASTLPSNSSTPQAGA